jgi:MoxR-like ATPase
LGLAKEAGDLQADDAIRRLIQSGKRNLLFYGPPRTGKSHWAVQTAANYLRVTPDKVLSDPRFKRVQFHQGWSYGDFIRKIVPVPAGGSITFARANGLFLGHCLANQRGPSVFVIEEINRASVSQVLGEAFQVLEEEYRGMPVALPATLADDKINSLVIPPDMLVIATANNIDRTTLPLDFAFLSRFSTVPFPVRYDIVFSILSGTAGWTAATAESFVVLLREVEAISGYPIGHAHFYAFGSPASVDLWFRTSLRPALENWLTRFRAEDLARVDRLLGDWVARLG